MINFEKIAKEYGTPTFIYDISTLKKRISYLKENLPENINLVYAVKANTFIIKELEKDVERFEICSKGEFDICNKLNIDYKKMVISGVNKDDASIDEMISNYKEIGKYTIESVNQYKLLKEKCEKYNRNINVLIRLTSGNQFGVNEEEAIDILKENNEFINISGFEYFSGTQKHSIKKINKEIDYLVEFVNKVEQELNISIEEIEYGPGFPVYYFQDDEFAEDEFLKEVCIALEKMKNKKISLELGRSIAASCGYYLTKVVDMKTNKNGNHIILDGGINHLVYYGQTMAMRIPKYKLLPEKEDTEETYNLYGSLCTINDIIIKSLKTRKLQTGDLFVFENVGAYSITEGIALFLSRDMPKVILYDETNESKLIRNTIKSSEINCPKY
ncbi:MAG: diaminopimelate decarboxylase family protein [Candidatus Coprovivens sp.]